MNVAYGWLLAVVVVLLRWSCRVSCDDDPRPALRASATPYVYAIQHCHQLGAVLGAEAGTAAMVSRSSDGDLIVPSLRVNGVIPVRGSSRKHGVDKGGAAALDRLVEHVRGGGPAYLAIDGPRGPRGRVQPGVARLALATGAVILVALPVTGRRWILGRTWDRFQIPKPFTSIELRFAPPLVPRRGESEDDLRLRVEELVANLESQYDPSEAAAGRIPQP